jgi:hypothetical protein
MSGLSLHCMLRHRQTTPGANAVLHCIALRA